MIALEVEKSCIADLDDKLAGSKAKSLNLDVKGTLGILRQAYERDIIGRKELTELIRQLKIFDFQISG